MHVHTIVAFAFLFWRAESPPNQSPLFSGSMAPTLAFALGQPLLLTLAAAGCVRIVRRQLTSNPRRIGAIHRFHHRCLSTLRILLVAGFGVTTLATDWPAWFNFGRVAPSLQIFGDLIALSPYLAGCVALWIAAFPCEHRLRDADAAPGVVTDSAAPDAWQFSSYLDFHVRHHLLVVAVPMLLILFASNVIRGHETRLQRFFGFAWAPDAALGVTAAGVFLVAPFLLRRLWRTAPLGPGPLRDRLEALCRRIGLRCREILVWKSDGLMINAAVMGVIPGVRYVLLSDALLDAMTPRQVEAVFGHEAGHVRHRHIQHFLLLAFIGWIAAGGVLELASWAWTNGGETGGSSLPIVQGLGLLAVFLIWMLSFGWLSRRFERQADLFGARCVTPEPADCRLPCSVHRDGVVDVRPERVCSSAAALFASALETVARLSGIPRDERSWRHSSVAARVRFLHALAADPALAVRFERVVRRAKRTLLILAIAGTGATACFLSALPASAWARRFVRASPTDTAVAPVDH